jgi:hypothetical protein
MVEAFVETGGQRTIIPGGPFANKALAGDAVYAYAAKAYGSYKAMTKVIDACGFIVPGPSGESNVVYIIGKP